MFANEPAPALPLTSACRVVHQTPGFCLSLLTARNLSRALSLGTSSLCVQTWFFPGHNGAGGGGGQGACLCLSGIEVLGGLDAPSFSNKNRGERKREREEEEKFELKNH